MAWFLFAQSRSWSMSASSASMRSSATNPSTPTPSTSATWIRPRGTRSTAILFRFTNRGLDWQGPPTRLGQHVEPIFLLIAPLYLIHSGPETLLVLQTVALALGGCHSSCSSGACSPICRCWRSASSPPIYWSPCAAGRGALGLSPRHPGDSAAADGALGARRAALPLVRRRRHPRRAHQRRRRALARAARA